MFYQELLRDKTLCKHLDGGLAGHFPLETVFIREVQYRPVTLERKAQGGVDFSSAPCAPNTRIVNVQLEDSRPDGPPCFPLPAEAGRGKHGLSVAD